MVSLLAALLVPLAVSSGSRAADTTTVATYRRSLAVGFAGTLVWLVCAGAGLAYAAISQNTLGLGNSVIFGAFLCAGFQTLVVNGAFVGKTPVSVLLGSLQPAIILAAVLLAGGTTYSGYAAIPSLFAVGTS